MLLHPQLPDKTTLALSLFEIEAFDEFKRRRGEELRREAGGGSGASDVTVSYKLEYQLWMEWEKLNVVQMVSDGGHSIGDCCHSKTGAVDGEPWCSYS